MNAAGDAPKRRFELGCGHVVLVILVAAGLLVFRIGHIERRKKAVEDVQQLGGKVLYGKDVAGPEWLQAWFPAHVLSVELSGTAATNTDLAFLKALGRLERLDLGHTQITNGGLEPLAGLTRLQFLSLEVTGVGDDDLRQIERLTKLTALNLAGTQVSDAGLSHLQNLIALEGLDIGYSRITGAGFESLHPLAGLQQLGIDASQVTAPGVAQLQLMAGLKRVSVDVRHGTGKPTRDLLAPLTNVQVLAWRTVARGEASGARQATEGRLWDNSTPWELSTGGIVETILSHVPLKPEESERLLDILASARPAGNWGSTIWSMPVNQPPLPVVPVSDRIKSGDQLIEALKKGDRNSLAGALLYARSGKARTAIPRLLELLKSPDEKVRRRTVTTLIRIDLTDKRVAAAIERMLKDADEGERARTVHAFADGSMGYPPSDRIGPAAAKFAVPLLAGLSRDESRMVRLAVAETLGDIARGNPQEAKAIMPLILKMLTDREIGGGGAYAVEKLVQGSPEQAEGITRALIGMLQHTRGEGRSTIAAALCAVAPYSAEAAEAAVPVILELLRQDLPLQWTTAEEGTLVGIVERYPGQIKQIVPAALKMSEQADGPSKSAASRALSSVAAGLYAGNARRHAAAKP